MWCALFLYIRLICHAPRLGDILSCHWHGIIAPQYRLALSLQEATNIAGTPPQVCGRSWESIIIIYVCHRTNRAAEWSNVAFYRSGCAVFRFYKRTLQHPSWRCPLCCFAFQPHKICTQNTMYLVVKVQYCMRLKVHLTNQDKNRAKVRGD